MMVKASLSGGSGTSAGPVTRRISSPRVVLVVRLTIQSATPDRTGQASSFRKVSSPVTSA